MHSLAIAITFIMGKSRIIHGYQIEDRPRSITWSFYILAAIKPPTKEEYRLKIRSPPHLISHQVNNFSDRRMPNPWQCHSARVVHASSSVKKHPWSDSVTHASYAKTTLVAMCYKYNIGPTLSIQKPLSSRIFLTCVQYPLKKQNSPR